MITYIKKITVVLITITLFAAISGCSKEVAIVEQDPIVVKKEGIEVWGEVKVKDTKDIVIDFPYTITDIYVQEGQIVKKGDVLLTIDYTNYLQELSKKEKEIQLAKVSTENYSSDTSAMEQEVQSLSNELSLKQKYMENVKSDTEYNRLELELEKENINLNTAANDLEKNKRLFSSGVISKKELDTFTEQYEKAENSKKSIEVKMQELKTTRQLEIDKLKNQIALTSVKMKDTTKTAANISNVAVLKADIAQIEKTQMEKKLSKTFVSGNQVICDVEEGIIQSVDSQKGYVLNTASDYGKIMTILDTSTLHVVADVPEEFIRNVSIGDKAEIMAYANREQILEGEVVRISDMAVKENGETVVKVEINVVGDHKGLKPGFTVDVTIL